MDWINNNFSDNLNLLLETFKDISDSDKKNIKSQFSGVENNSDKYKWLEILQKDVKNESTTKKYYKDIYNLISDYKDYFNQHCTTIEKLEIGRKYTKKQISLLAGSGDIMSGIISSKIGDKKDTFITIDLDSDYPYKSIDGDYKNTRNIFNKETKELKYYLYTKENARDYQVLEFSKNKSILFNSLGHDNNSGYVYAFVDTSGDNLLYLDLNKNDFKKYKGYIYIGKYIFKDISNTPPYYFTLKNADSIISQKEISEFKINSQVKSIDVFEKALKKEIHMDDEEKRAFVKIRTNQGYFRDLLLEKYDGKCPLTNFENKDALIASHIKPWSKCRSKLEKVDENNGILLSALADKLFDKGLISFTNDGRIIYSKKLSDSDISIFKKHLINEEFFLKKYINPQMAKYLSFHQNYIYLG